MDWKKKRDEELETGGVLSPDFEAEERGLTGDGEAVETGAESGQSLAVPRAVIGTEEVRRAAMVLQKYKEGKANLERRIIENEQWFKMLHWAQLRKEGKAPGGPEPASAWLFNSIANKHADAMDSFPKPNVLPREEGDREDAKMLSSVLPVILERSGFEQVYSDVWWYKLKAGTGVYGVFWNPRLENGLGDIDIRKLDILNLFWEPGISDIQQSRNLFSVELIDNEVLRSRYPEWKERLGGDVIDVAKYIYDDTVDTTDKTVVVDWYYKIERPGGGKLLHYVKFVGDTVLFASENEPRYQERGFYDHGEYPVVFDTLFLEEGTPAGFGYIDIMRDAQGYIDRLGGAILKNTMVGARPRFFVKDTASINEEEFGDLSKDFVHVAGTRLDDENLKQITVEPVSSAALNVLQMKIDELKETSGNRDFSQGSTASGVTAASAIAALQEAGSKLSRDMNKSGYRAFQKINYLCIELIRQFYDEPRSFRITGGQGEEQFALFDNRRLRPVKQDGVFGVDTGFRRPVFDIEVVSQKASPFNTIAQNELAKELFSMGFFNPQLSDQALCAVELMDFEGKEMVRQKISQNGTLLQMVQQMQAQMQKMALIIDAQNGTSVSGEVAGAAPDIGRPAASGADGTAAAMDAMGRESLSSTAGKARLKAAEAGVPR